MIYPVDHKFKDADAVYSLTVEDVQVYAQEILERQLTTNEIIEVIDRLDEGINAHLDLIMRTVLTDIDEQN